MNMNKKGLDHEVGTTQDLPFFGLIPHFLSFPQYAN